MEAVKKTGEAMAKDIYDALNSYCIDTKNLAFQSYDYASNMSGKTEGVHTKLSALIGHTAPYIPCQAHRTYPGLEHSCEASLIITEFFNVLEELYVFFSSSTKRTKELKDHLKEIENV